MAALKRWATQRMVQPPLLFLSIEGVGDTIAVEMKGELSLRTIDMLERHLELLAVRRQQVVIFDLTGLTELDAAGARILMSVHNYVRGAGGICRVTGGNDDVARLLDTASSETEPGLHPGAPPYEELLPAS